MKRRETGLPFLWNTLFVAVTLLAPRSEAQDAKRTFASPGVFELGGSASYSYNQPVVNGKTSDGTHAIAVTPFIGYFVADGLEVVANPLGFSYSKTGSQTQMDLRLLGGLAYNLKVQPGIYPFIEGLAGFTSRTSDSGGGETTVSGFSWGGRGGVKFAVTSHGMVNVGVQYLQVTLSPSGANERNGTNELSVSAGFTVWL